MFAASYAERKMTMLLCRKRSGKKTTKMSMILCCRRIRRRLSGASRTTTKKYERKWRMLYALNPKITIEKGWKRKQ